MFGNVKFPKKFGEILGFEKSLDTLILKLKNPDSQCRAQGKLKIFKFTLQALNFELWALKSGF